MVQTPSDRLRSYWPPNRPPVERPMPEVADEATSQGQPWTQRLAECMGERPILTLVTAAAIGVFLGWMVKRR
jgi:ElaB/YqjD/DUF883 family membrane-anchored ribosome-binding protein